MKCVVCHGEQIQMSDVREELKIANDIVYVPVKVPVCQTCGERYYDRRTVRLLEEIELQARQGRSELEEVGKVFLHK
jgi:YgiT-type zinc finger domain-containing protein